MTIRQQGGVFGRNPTFNTVDVGGQVKAGSLDVTGSGAVDGPLVVGTGTAEAGLHVDQNVGGIFARFKRLSTQYIDLIQNSGISQIYAYGKAFQIGTGDAFSVAVRQNNNTRMTFNTSGHIEAGADNTQTMGTATRRWSEIFAGNGTINTSDGREKTDIESLNASEIAVAKRLKGLVRKFRFQSSIDAKGDAARIHVGVIAQDVKAAFEAEGLDPFAYGVLCFDRWEESTDSDGVVTPAGDRYGVRYDQLFAFIVAAL